jgi:hypothetical protein
MVILIINQPRIPAGQITNEENGKNKGAVIFAIFETEQFL